LAQLEQLMRSHGSSDAVAHQKALMLLDGMLRKQAAMLAFEHLFLAFGVMMLAALPLLLLMRRSQFNRQGPSTDH
jgi:DHA2 family multidrug resistance protein